MTITSTGVFVLEMWAMLTNDESVVQFYNEYNQTRITYFPTQFIQTHADDEAYVAVFIPGDMVLGIPRQDSWSSFTLGASKDLYTIALCHGPGSYTATQPIKASFIKTTKWRYFRSNGCKDSHDWLSTSPMPWKPEQQLRELGVQL